LNVGDEESGSPEGRFSRANDGGVGAVHVEFTIAGGIDPGPGDFEDGKREFDQSGCGARKRGNEKSDTQYPQE
jgi:hypothetical protein